MKRRQLLLVGFLVFLTAIATRVYLSAGFPFTHDGENHLARMANYKLALRQGQFPPRWAPNLLNHFGYPVFNYNYPLANIFSLPLSFIKVPYESIFKLQVVLATSLLMVGSWYFLSLWSKNSSSKIFAVSALAASPTLASTLIFRGSIGEVWALALSPWIIYWTVQSIDSSREQQRKPYAWLLATISWVAFFLCHNISVLYGTPLLLCVVAILVSLQHIRWAIVARILGLAIGLSLWFWLPALSEKSLIVLDGASLSQQITTHLLSAEQLLWSPLSFGFSWIGSIDSAAVGFGVLQLLAILILGCQIFVRGIQKRQVSGKSVLILLVVTMLLFLQTTWSAPLWQVLPLVRFVQFPWRLSILASVLVLPLIASSWEHSPRFIKVGLIGILIVQLVITIRVQPVDRFHKPNASYEEFAQSTSTSNENLPKTFTYTDLASWQPTPLFLTASGSATVQQWSGTSHKYQLQVSVPGQIVEPTARFPGWRTEIRFGGNSRQVEYVESQEIGGRIAYAIDQPGQYEVKTSFTEQTQVRLLGNSVSLATGVAVFVSYWYEHRKKIAHA